MNRPLLIVGNKLHATWSLRAWFLMRAFDIDFDHRVLSIYQADSKPRLLAISPSGRVPVLIDGDVTVWDSLAITEYLAEKHPNLTIWPRDSKARAHARSLCAEMHAEFRALRAGCPMNLGKRFGPKDRGEAVASDVARIAQILRDTRTRLGGGGPCLFGELCAVDAMFLPVLTRFETYSISVDATTRTYMDTMLKHSAFLEWRAAALNEEWIVPKVEVDEPPIENLRKRH